MQIDLQKLKAAAEAASAGVWTAGVTCRGLGGVVNSGIGAWVECYRSDGYGGRDAHEENKAFIAAANPTVVLALIAEIERITKACNAHGHALQMAAQAAGLLAGADMHRDLVPAIEKLSEFVYPVRPRS